jgi:hypothetical protein
MSKKFSITIIEAPDQNQRENPNNQFSNSEPMTFAQKVDYIKNINMTNNKQQTAVEWLVEHWKKLQLKGEKMSWNQIIQITELVKEMEKEQIEEAFANGVDDEYEWHINNVPRKNSETYYNETYGGGEQ